MASSKLLVFKTTHNDKELVLHTVNSLIQLPVDFLT